VSDDRNARDEATGNASLITPFSTAGCGKQPSNVDSSGPIDDITTDTASADEDDGGQPVDNPERPDIAHSALVDARRIARAMPRRRDREAARRTRKENLAGRNRGGYSAAGPDPTRDPQRIGPILAGYVEDRGWERPIAEARVFAEWPALVGAEVAARCAPQSLTDGELRITAESTAWATQLRLLSRTLLARLVAELGPQIVTKLVITGPVGPSWKHGNRSVRGARGPRDTYG
jgi:predicted nucleic acid-binding Zn ribbon protein